MAVIKYKDPKTGEYRVIRCEITDEDKVALIEAVLDEIGNITPAEVYVGAEEPTNGEVLWMDTDDDTEDGGFILTDAEKAEIAQMAADKVDVSGKADKTEVPNAAIVENNELTMMRDENPLFSVPLPASGGSGGADENWRYIGAFTTDTDVVQFIVSADADGKPLNLKKCRIWMKLYGNSAGKTQLTKVGVAISGYGTKVNEFWFPDHSKAKIVDCGNGFAYSESAPEKYYSYVRDFVKCGDFVFCVGGYKSSNNDSTKDIVSQFSFSANYDNMSTPMIGNIGVVGVGSYTESVGAGTTIEIWGVDAE